MQIRRLLSWLTLALLLIPLLGCNFFARQNTNRSSELENQLFALIDQLEASGQLQAGGQRAILVARFGTTFGNSASINPFLGERYIGIEPLVRDCERRHPSIENRNRNAIRNCLVRQHSEGADPLDYSHGGIAYKSGSAPDWQIRQTFRSPDQILFRTTDRLDSFPYVALYEHRILVIVPTLEFQQRLYNALINYRVGSAVISPEYNAVALPFQTETQQSSQWVLEVLAASRASPGSVTGREQAQEVLRNTGYGATPVVIGGIQRLGRFDNLFGAIDLEGHPYARRLGLAEIVTFRSIERWMKRNRWVEAVYTVYPNRIERDF